MQKIKLSAGITAYEDLNSDAEKVVVFLHGGTIPSWCYDHVFESHKNKNARLIRYDMYGRGGSDGPKAIYNRAFYLKQLEELLEELEIEKIDTLVGASFGASVATLFSFKHPHMVKKIAYISPAFNWIKNTPAAKVFSIPLLGRLFYDLKGKKLIRERALGFIEALNEDFSKKYKALIEEQFAPNSDAFWDSLYSQLTTDALRSYEKEYENLALLEKHDVHLIWGVGDKEVSQEDINKMKAYFKKIKVTDVHGSGHGLMAEFPEKVSDFIGEIIDL